MKSAKDRQTPLRARSHTHRLIKVLRVERRLWRQRAYIKPGFTACPTGPLVDPAFQCPAYLIGHSFLAELVLEDLEDRDSNDALDPKKFLNARPERLEWIGPGPPVAPLLLLGGKLRTALDPARCAR